MSHNKNIGYCKGQEYEKADHLAYLRIEPALFETEEEKILKTRHLCCEVCGYPVVKVADKVEIHGRHEWAFPLYNEIIQLGCYRYAEGCVGERAVSFGYSWFRGYGWQIQVCRSCHMQLGWKYISPEETFFGLMFNTLKDEDIEKEG